MPNELTEQLIDELKAENKELRFLLWAYHNGHYRFLYGDDGEMQCLKCKLDFERDDLTQLKKGMFNAR